MIDGHLTLDDINPDNYRYIEKPNKNFSRERNYKVIQDVIKANDKMQTELNKKVADNAGNVSDILASWAKYTLNDNGTKNIRQWLGREALNKIYGDKLLDKIGRLKEIQRQNLSKGNTILDGLFYI